MTRGPYKRSIESRFWFYVDKSGECWLWIGGTDWDGYGQFRAPELGEGTAHRTSWTLKNGSIPKGMYVLHKCDNPHCVRPDHLYLGTRADNMRDMAERQQRWK